MSPLRMTEWYDVFKDYQCHAVLQCTVVSTDCCSISVPAYCSWTGL